jgi:hypothetical protein
MTADSPGDIPCQNPYDPESSQDPALTALREATRHEEAVRAIHEVSFERALVLTSTTWVSPLPNPHSKQATPKTTDTWPKLKYPPRFLADIGLYSIFLIIHQQKVTTVRGIQPRSSRKCILFFIKTIMYVRWFL